MPTYIKLAADNQTIDAVAVVAENIDYANIVSGFQLVPDAVSANASITTTTHYVNSSGDVVQYSDELIVQRDNRKPQGYDWNVDTGWVDNRTASEEEQQNRLTIEALLAGCDWTQLPDTKPSTTAAYLTYRNALRALPSNPSWPDVVFPADPNIGRLD
jgi:hypothetical protein